MKKLTKKIQKLKLFQTKVTTLFFAFIGVFALSFVGYFLYFQVSGPKAVDEVLPADDLVFLAEFERNDLEEFLQQNASFKTYFFEPLMQQYFNQNLADFNDQAKKWLGNKMAIANYQKETEVYYLLLENNNQRKALEFLRSLGLKGEELKKEEYKNSMILSFSQSLNVKCSFLYGYLICSNESDALKKLIDFNQLELGALSALGNYNKVKNNLPKFPGGKLYFNLQKIDFSAFEFYFGPLKEYLREGGIAFTQTEEGVRLNSYLALEKGLTATGSIALKNELADFVSAENLAFYFNGTNLTQSVKQIFKIWDKASPYFQIILEGMLRARVVDYFGAEVSLEEDFYPLLSNGYAVEVQLLPKPRVKIILEVKDEAQTKAILAKMLEGVYLKNAILKAEKKEIVLRDESVVKELQIDDSQVQKTQTDFEGVKIEFVQMPENISGFAYAFVDDQVFISNDPEFIQPNLHLLQDPTKSLSNSPIYQKIKALMLLEGEETSFFDCKQLRAFLEVFGLPEQSLIFLSDFDYAFFSTKWFDDGMANEAIFLKSETKSP